MRNRNRAIKIKFQEMILLILLEICTVYFIFSTVSQFNFRNNIIKGYEETYPIKDGMFISFREISNPEILDIKDAADLQLERNLYSFLTTDNEVIDKLYYNTVNLYEEDILGIEKPKEKSFKTGISDNIIYSFLINKEYYDDYIKNNIVGSGFQDEDFISKEQSIPIIIGNSFKKNYDIGQVIKSDKLDRNFKVVGFLDKDRFIFTNNGLPSVGIENLNTSIIMPYNEEALKMAIKNNLSMMNEEDQSNEDSLLIYDLTSIIPTMTIKISPNYSLTKAKEILTNQLSDKGMNVELLTIKSDIDNFLEKFNDEILFNTILILVLGILSIMILITTVNYKIIKFKFNIGILYSIGATTNEVFKIFFYKLLQSSFISLVIGSLIYISIRKTVYKFFVNNIYIEDILLSILIYISIIVFSFIVSITKMKKIAPVELLKEGRE